MHSTSFLKAKAFVDAYVNTKFDTTNEKIRILDVGSKSYSGHDTYRELLMNNQIEYIGLDVEKGKNVDIVPKNAFIWNELENESFDFCISGQTFEHNPFFWVTFSEIARILKQDGMVCVIAPGRGEVHRYPVDCWRFYPDAWNSLCVYSGLEIVECTFEDFEFNHTEEGAEWCDSCVVARKPSFNTIIASDIFYTRISNITSTLPDDTDAALNKSDKPAVALKAYLTFVRSSNMTALIRRLLRPRALYKRIFRYF